MTYEEYVRQGAKHQSYQDGNPRPILRKIVDSNRGAPLEQIEEIFRNSIEDDPDYNTYISVILSYWVHNNYNSLMSERRDELKSKCKQTTQIESESLKAAAKETIRAVGVRVVLLDLPMSNGKFLRHCTNRDLGKEEGWIGKVRGKLSGKQTVEDVLSEKELRKLRSAK